MGELSCGLEDVYQHLWSLHIRHQENTLPKHNNQKCLQIQPDVPCGHISLSRETLPNSNIRQAPVRLTEFKDNNAQQKITYRKFCIKDKEQNKQRSGESQRKQKQYKEQKKSSSYTMINTFREIGLDRASER